MPIQQAPQPANQPKGRRLRRRHRWLDFSASIQNLQDSFRPEDLVEHLLPGEEPLLEIQLAWYRDILGRVIIDHFAWYLLLTGIITFITAVVTSSQNYHWGIAIIPLGISFTFFLMALHQRIIYLQYRVLRTNVRFIISIPQPNGFPLVDNIELKGLPQVVDQNWSRNPAWRFFQFFTGARDVYLSLAAYRFVEGTARVGDALVIPDVMPDDVFDLKRLVFGL
jgi:hypothetical protein